MLIVDLIEAVPGAKISQETTNICGVPAQHVVATGLTSAAHQNQRNIDVYFFRIEPYMYTFMYTFQSPKPNADAQAALLTLCPTTQT